MSGMFLFIDSRVKDGRGWKLVVDAVNIYDARKYARATVTGNVMVCKGECGKGELENLAKAGATAAVTPEREKEIHENFIRWIDSDL